jgi:hypothetical protein
MDTGDGGIPGCGDLSLSNGKVHAPTNPDGNRPHSIAIWMLKFSLRMADERSPIVEDGLA